MSESKGSGTGTFQLIIREFPDGRKDLTIAIQGHCSACGPFQLNVPGHHARMLRDVCQTATDKFPDLTQSEVTVSDVTPMPDRPRDPSVN